MILKVSPTQISAFRACRTLWYRGWILRLKAPSTRAQEIGSDIHKHVEDYAERKNPDLSKPHLASLRAAIRDGHIPTCADTPGLKVEQHAGTLKFRVPPQKDCPDCGGTDDSCGTCTLVEANGKIDLTYPWPEEDPLVIRDYKSCSSFNYCKTPEQLAEDDQAIFYASEIRARGWKGKIIFEHFYLRSNSSAYKVVRTEPMSGAYLDQKLLEMAHDVCEMSRTASKDSEEIEKDETESHCRKYGGCFHLGHCQTALPPARPGEGLMRRLNLAGTPGTKAQSPLASRLEAAKADPKPPTRYDVLYAAVEAGVKMVEAFDRGTDVEATAETFHTDLWAFIQTAVEQGSVNVAIEPVEDMLDDLADSDWESLIKPGHVVAKIPQGEVNPPDASQNAHPEPGEEPLRDLGLDGRAAAPLERAGINNMADLLGALKAGTDLTTLDGVGAGAAVKAQSLAISHLLSGAPVAVAAAPEPEQETPALAADQTFLYVGCSSPSAVSASQAVFETFGAEEYIRLVGLDYDDGKKEVMSAFSQKPLEVFDRFPEISIGNGYFDSAVFTALAPYATKIVR